MTKLTDLINRAKACKQCPTSLSREQINLLQTLLEINFSNDFIEITERYIYECLYGAYIEFYSLYNKDLHYSGVVEQTLVFRRKLFLPDRYVLLSDMGDAGAVFMETQDSPNKPSPVIYCDQMDVDSIIKEQPLKYNPTIWPSFTDFFEYLVEQEEAMLKEQEK